MDGPEKENDGDEIEYAEKWMRADFFTPEKPKEDANKSNKDLFISI